jgi:sigma-B regulation protein RsbU (phosphoserine phosphatase)
MTKDQPVLAAGDQNDTLYLVLAGQLFALLDPSRPQDRVPIVAGECFGEMSLIEGKPVSATVVADEGTQVLAIPDTVFWSTIAKVEGVARGLLRAMSDRMRKRSELVAKSLREHLELQAVQRELRLAQEVQISMLADGSELLADYPSLDAAAVMIPAKVVGGDFYDAFGTDPHHVFLALGDVAGKGMSAALFMARSLATLRLEVVSGKPQESLLLRFNDAMCEHNVHSTFVTMFAAYLDTRDGVLTYLNAGHHAALRVTPAGAVIPLPPPEGMVAGVFPGGVFETARQRLDPGDLLVAYTDGVSEAQNAEGGFFGEQRMIDTLVLARPASAGAAVEAVRAALAAFTGDAPQSDDITVLAVRYLGPCLPV